MYCRLNDSKSLKAGRFEGRLGGPQYENAADIEAVRQRSDLPRHVLGFRQMVNLLSI
jgi:hypothetical protein